MSPRIDRRTFLRGAGAAAAAALAGPLALTSRASAQGDKLVVAVGQWGIETPFAWRSSQSEKTLWECGYDSLITRDPKTFAIRPGLATEWKPSNEMKTWTFKLRRGVTFHEGYGEMTAEDVKYTVEQNLKPDAQGGSAPFFRINLDRIEVPDKYTVVMRLKEPFAPLLPGVRFVPPNDVAALEAAGDDDVGLILLEPILGEGGVVPLTAEFAAAAAALPPLLTGD